MVLSLFKKINEAIMKEPYLRDKLNLKGNVKKSMKKLCWR